MGNLANLQDHVIENAFISKFDFITRMCSSSVWHARLRQIYTTFPMQRVRLSDQMRACAAAAQATE